MLTSPRLAVHATCHSAQPCSLLFLHRFTLKSMACRASSESDLDSRAKQAASELALPSEACSGSRRAQLRGAHTGGDSALQLVAVRDLRPTQLAVGMYEVW